jgi:hypothetical protein
VHLGQIDVADPDDGRLGLDALDGADVGLSPPICRQVGDAHVLPVPARFLGAVVLTEDASDGGPPGGA